VSLVESFHVFPSDLPGGLGGSVARRVVPSGLEDSVVRRVVSSGREAGGGVAALGADTAVADEVFVAGRPMPPLGYPRGGSWFASDSKSPPCAIPCSRRRRGFPPYSPFSSSAVLPHGAEGTTVGGAFGKLHFLAGFPLPVWRLWAFACCPRITKKS
jgi:hypothetical protein